jgi:leucyl-tRNA synthetase
MRFAVETAVLLLSPIVPHAAQELWESLGFAADDLPNVPWPEFKEDALAADTILVVVQVNGKLRSRFTIDANADDTAIKEKALADENVSRFTEGKAIKKVIVVKKQLVNIVV